MRKVIATTVAVLGIALPALAATPAPAPAFTLASRAG